MQWRGSYTTVADFCSGVCRDLCANISTDAVAKILADNSNFLRGDQTKKQKKGLYPFTSTANSYLTISVLPLKTISRVSQSTLSNFNRIFVMTALLQYIDLEKWQGGPRIIVGGFSPLSPPLCYALAHTLHTHAHSHLQRGRKRNVPISFRHVCIVV